MKESKETVKDENKESLGEQDKEKKVGTEKHDEHIISEEFQHEVNNLISEYKDSMPCLKFMSDASYSAQEDLRKREMNKKGNKIPKEYSTAQMP